MTLSTGLLIVGAVLVLAGNAWAWFSNGRGGDALRLVRLVRTHLLTCTGLILMTVGVLNGAAGARFLLECTWWAFVALGTIIFLLGVLVGVAEVLMRRTGQGDWWHVFICVYLVAGGAFVTLCWWPGK